MRCYLVISQMLLAGILVSAQVPERPKSGQTATRAERAVQLKRLADDIWTRTPEDRERVTRAYADTRLSEIRQIVREQVLEALGQNDNAANVREVLRAVLVKSYFRDKDTAWPFVYSSDLQGAKTVVVGYEWTYGALGIPSVKVVIDGFRKTGLNYELAGETGDGFQDCALQLDKLDSPRPNESWFLAHGPVVGASRQVERMRIYSFDGYQFKELWAPSELRMNPSFKIAADMVTITYQPDADRAHLLQDTIRLASGGPTVTTVEVRQ